MARERGKRDPQSIYGFRNAHIPISFIFPLHCPGMGTKLEYAIDPLATHSPQSERFISVHCVNDWDFLQTRGLKENYQRTGLVKYHNSMDRMLEKHNMESIKKTMQLHEDIFKHQVRELHRLYSVQKMLMGELKMEIKQNRLWSSSNTDINHSQIINQRQYSPSQAALGYNFHIPGLRDDHPSSKERSGSSSGDTMRIARGFDLERPAEEDISTGVSAVDEDRAGPSSHMRHEVDKMSGDGSDEDSDVELTLSIGGSTGKKRPKACEPHRSQGHKETRELDSTASFKSDRGEDCSGPNTPMSSSSTTFDQDRKRPHWLFQGLSINRT